MTETLFFPGLGLEFDINRVAFHLPDFLGGRPIYWYGVIIAAAFLTAALYAMSRVKEFGLDPDRVIDVILAGVVLGIVGARLYYVIFAEDTYWDNPISILYIWEGGIAIYGGIIGAVLAGILMCRLRKVKLLPMLDLAAGAMLLGQSIGRWGNFVNMEAFGSNTSMPWGMTSASISAYLSRRQESLAAIGVTVDPSLPVHPTFLYESLWCLVGFLFLAWFVKRRRFDGQIALLYLGWYSLGRFFIEGLRTDSLLVGTLRVSQILALLLVLASLAILVAVLSKIKRAHDPDYLKLYVHTEEGQAVLAGTFYGKKDGGDKPEESGATGDEESGGEEPPSQEEESESYSPPEEKPGEDDPSGEEGETSADREEE